MPPLPTESSKINKGNYAMVLRLGHNILLEFNDPWRPSNEQQVEILREEQVWDNDLLTQSVMQEGPVNGEWRREGIYDEFLCNLRNSTV